MRSTLTTTVLALLALSAAACGGTSSSSSSGGGGYREAKSPMACGHWNNIKGDVSAGILTDSELRTKISEVRDAATDSTVKSAATTLLAGITANSSTQITAGAKALNAACS
jgi:Spy/CpxP family protein refolding chaperone